MSEPEKIILTAAATLIGGMVLFILSEFIRVTMILPIQKLQEEIQNVLSKIDFHSNMLTNYFSDKPSEQEQATIHVIRNDLRTTATQLKSKYAVINSKRLLSHTGFIPSSENIDIAYKCLMYLHNSILISGKRAYVINEIDMNHNQIERIQAALVGNQIPKTVSPKEKSN